MSQVHRISALQSAFLAAKQAAPMSQELTLTSTGFSSKEPIMNTIKHLQVTPKGIHSDQLNMLGSINGLKSIYKTAIFSATQGLLNQSTKLQKFGDYLDRLETGGFKDKVDTIKATPRYTDLKAKAEQLGQRLAILDSLQDAKGFNIDIEIMPMMQRSSNQEEIAKKAAFAKVSVEYVQKAEDAAKTRSFNDSKGAVHLAESFFYSAEVEEAIETDEETGEIIKDTLPLFFHPESCLKDLMRSRDFLLTWNAPDYAELGILASDIETMEAATARFIELTEQATEESREFDDKAANSQDLMQGAGDAAE